MNILSLLLMASISLAGFRTIGNGGGFGEMKAHLAFRNMERSLAACLNVSTVCELTSAERTLLRSVAKSLDTETRQGGVSFFDDPSLSQIIKTVPQVGSKIELNSSALTTPDGIAVSYESISAMVLQGLMQHQASTLGASEQQKLGQKVFAKIRESVATSALTTEGAITGNGILVVQLHAMNIYDFNLNQVVYSSLLVETPKQTYDLMANSKVHSLCPAGRARIRVQNQSAGPKLGDLTATVQWSCDGEGWGQAVVFFHLVSDGNEGLVWPVAHRLGNIMRPAL